MEQEIRGPVANDGRTMPPEPGGPPSSGPHQEQTPNGASPSTPVEPPPIPGFDVVRLLGSGGYSDVFLYSQQLPRRDVAIKVLRESALGEGGRAAFVDEANLMAAVSAHPYIVTIFHAEVLPDGQPYLVMEYYPLPDYGARSKGMPLPIAEVLRTGIRIASAVETAHRAGIVHRDIKPANILMNAYGRPGLTDFGIASAAPDTDVSGLSVPWSSPEILAGTSAADVRSDVFSLAATIYTLAAGRSPFVVPGESNTNRVLYERITTGVPTPLDRGDVPTSLDRLLRVAMARGPGVRPASAADLAKALQDVEVELDLSVTPIDVPDEMPFDPHTDAGSSGAGRLAPVSAADRGDRGNQDDSDESTVARRPRAVVDSNGAAVAAASGSVPWMPPGSPAPHGPGVEAPSADDPAVSTPALHRHRRRRLFAALGSIAVVGLVVGLVIGFTRASTPPIVPPSIGTLAATRLGTCAIAERGSVRCWGGNQNGETGDLVKIGPHKFSGHATDLKFRSTAEAITAGGQHVCALLRDRSVWCWGSNHYGQLGTDAGAGSHKPNPKPVEVRGLPDVTEIAAGDEHTCALARNGSVWCWGHNDHGQLGNGTNLATDRATTRPVRVTTMPALSTISAGGRSNCGIADDGTVWCWGDNSKGQLGPANNGADPAVNVAPMSLPGIRQVRAVAVGDEHACALLADRRVACWGDNTSGQTGVVQNFRIGSNATPVVVQYLNGAVDIAAGLRHTCAELFDGSVRCWGRNHSGEIGTASGAGPEGGSAQPVRVEGVEHPAALALGEFHSCAMLSDRTVWCWGGNGWGQLGAVNNVGTSAPNPVAVRARVV
jgi:alpha-tubulin suppressor-like RCC1 family protein/serine/threonine protein kinase